jgi:hypothetical protein
MRPAGDMRVIGEEEIAGVNIRPGSGAEMLHQPDHGGEVYRQGCFRLHDQAAARIANRGRMIASP